jgi:DNA modification methylase
MTEPFYEKDGITIYNENCLDTMARMPAGFIDLTVTSPPYDNLRDYKGYSFDFEPIAQELFRVTKTGGVVVWIVNDATVKGSETGTSFKQALYFKEIGFRLHDTMIYAKKNPMPVTAKRYQPAFEYMFILSKSHPNTVNLIREKTKLGGKPTRGERVNKDGTRTKTSSHGKPIKATKVVSNIWKYGVGSNGQGHPAIFPEQLASDHIISWSNPGDLVFDPFSGSGTTAKMALLNGRNYIGSEIAEEYCQIAEERIDAAAKQRRLFE